MLQNLLLALSLTGCIGVSSLNDYHDYNTNTNELHEVFKINCLNRSHSNFVDSDFDYIYNNLNDLPILNLPNNYLGYTRSLDNGTLYFNGRNGAYNTLPYYASGYFDALSYEFTNNSFDFYSNYSILSYIDDSDLMLETMGRLWEYNFAVRVGTYLYPCFPQFQFVIDSNNFINYWLVYDLEFLKGYVNIKGNFNNYNISLSQWVLNDGTYTDMGTDTETFITNKVYNPLNPTQFFYSYSTEEYLYIRDKLSIVFNVVSNEYQTGYSDGYSIGYDVGHQIGFDEGLNSTNTLVDLFWSITDTPIIMLKSLFLSDFQIFGFTLFGLITGLLTIALVTWVIRKFL